MTGLTDRQAERLRERVTKRAMQIEATLRAMVDEVGDVSWSRQWTGEAPDTILEQVREVESDLHAIIDRRRAA